MARLITAIFSLALLLGCHPKEPDRGTSTPIPFLSGTGSTASRDYKIRLPDDHASHPEFDIEWWYLTSNLTDDQGNDYAFQWTLFRFANRVGDNAWDAGQVYMGHASLHTETGHWFNEKFASGGSERAGITLNPLNYYIDNWYWKSNNTQRFPSTVFADLVLPEQRAKVSLSLDSSAEFVLHGDEGYSIKTADQSHASHYYSQPFIDVEGTLDINGNIVEVHGMAWYDHEWSSQLVNADTLGWDWVSLHLDSGDKLMAFRMRTEGTKYITGTHISKQGIKTVLPPDAIDMRVTEKHKTSESFPLHWAISVPSKDLVLELVADKDDAVNQGVFSYYEGAISVTGSHQGRGFLEMTGY